MHFLTEMIEKTQDGVVEANVTIKLDDIFDASEDEFCCALSCAVNSRISDYAGIEYKIVSGKDKKITFNVKIENPVISLTAFVLQNFLSANPKIKVTDNGKLIGYANGNTTVDKQKFEVKKENGVLAIYPFTVADYNFFTKEIEV